MNKKCEVCGKEDWFVVEGRCEVCRRMKEAMKTICDFDEWLICTQCGNCDRYQE